VSSPPVARLRLRDFRCFERLEWRPPAPRTLVVGGNGVGKTTLLEALYLAATGKSFRTGRLAQCARRGAVSFAVCAEVGAQPARELTVSWQNGTRERALDGRAASVHEHLSVLPVLVWSAGESELVGGAPEVRRRFLDRGLVHVRPSLLTDLSRYRRALGEKRALLARRQRGGLDAWNALLARHGAALARARATLAEEVNGELSLVAREVGDGLPPVALAYRPAQEAALAGEEALAGELDRAREQELARGMALVGPHRDDLVLEWNRAPARGAVSAGEGKALGLLLLAALARRLAAAGREPALLVDDADAELDATRAARLAAVLAGFSQVLVTSSRSEAWHAAAGFATASLEEFSSARAGGPDEAP
jgi:DNA replication and repair protein RecF